MAGFAFKGNQRGGEFAGGGEAGFFARSPSEVHYLALEALRQVDQALDGLPSKVKEAFLLAHLEGLSYSDIAERLDVSASSVKQYLARANQHCLFALGA